MEFSEGRAAVVVGGESEWEKERERERSEAEEEEDDREVRIAALERDLAEARVENEKLARENERLGRIVEKFKIKWEKLKEGARSKRAHPPTGGRGGSGGSNGGQLSRVDEAE